MSTTLPLIHALVLPRRNSPARSLPLINTAQRYVCYSYSVTMFAKEAEVKANVQLVSES